MLFDDYITAQAFDKIQDGETAELSLAQLIPRIINIKDFTENLDVEKAEKCRTLYDSYLRNRKKEVYDLKKLYGTVDDILKAFNDIIFK